MNALNISTSEPSVRLLTGGKYCEQDIVVETNVDAYDQGYDAGITDTHNGYLAKELTEIRFPSGITSLNQYAFYQQKNIKGVIDFPDKLTTIGAYAFRECAGITEYHGEGVTTIGNYTFYGNTALTVVDFPKLKTSGTYAFEYCTKLTEMTLPSLTAISGNFIYRSNNIKKIDLAVCTSIAANGFRGATGLTALIIRTPSVCTLANTNAFTTDTAIYKGTGYIYVPAALVESYKSATNWSTYANQFRAIEDYPEICGV